MSAASLSSFAASSSAPSVAERLGGFQATLAGFPEHLDLRVFVERLPAVLGHSLQLGEQEAQRLDFVLAPGFERHHDARLEIFDDAQWKSPSLSPPMTCRCR